MRIVLAGLGLLAASALVAGPLFVALRWPTALVPVVTLLLFATVAFVAAAALSSGLHYVAAPEALVWKLSARQRFFRCLIAVVLCALALNAISARWTDAF